VAGGVVDVGQVDPVKPDAMKVLVIRRDNIGDLVCTTPMIRTLRQHYPDAWIASLVTRYNDEVLADNSDLDAVLAYQKAKHRGSGESRARLTASSGSRCWNCDGHRSTS
jgi:ADP-heptose:LPS heptosyltransferase